MNHRFFAALTALTIGTTTHTAIAEPTPSLPASAYVLDDTVPIKVSLLPDATFLLQPTRVGIMTEHGIDWQRFANGLKATTRHDPNDCYAFNHVLGTLSNLWLQSAIHTREGDISMFFHYDAKQGWHERWQHNSAKGLYIDDVLPTDTGSIAHWRDADFSDDASTTVKPPGGHWWVADGTKLPPLERKGFTLDRMFPFADGEVWALGYVKRKARAHESEQSWQLRRWKPGGKIVIDELDGLPNSLLIDDPHDAVLSMHDKFLHFDGTSWQAMPWAGKAIGGELHRGKDGSLWSVLRTGPSAVIEHRLPDGTVQDLTPTNDWLAIEQVYGIETGAPWARLETGHIAYLSNRHGTWVEMLMPAPPKSGPHGETLPIATDIDVRSADDVWFSISYDGDDKNVTQHWAVLHMTTAPD